MAHKEECVTGQTQVVDEESGIEAQEEEEVVWGTMVDAEHLYRYTEDSTGLAVMKTQAAQAPVNKGEKDLIEQNQDRRSTKEDQPAFSYKLKAANPGATHRMF